MLEVFGHQEHLRHMPTPAAERTLPSLDQAALADCSHGLKMGQFGGPLGQADPSHAGPDRAGTDEHHLPTRTTDGIELPAQGLDSQGIEQPVGTREYPGANLDHDQASGRGDLLTERFAHWPGPGVVRGWDGQGTHYGIQPQSASIHWCRPRFSRDFSGYCGLSRTENDERPAS